MSSWMRRSMASIRVRTSARSGPAGAGGPTVRAGGRAAAFVASPWLAAFAAALPRPALPPPAEAELARVRLPVATSDHPDRKNAVDASDRLHDAVGHLGVDIDHGVRHLAA